MWYGEGMSESWLDEFLATAGQIGPPETAKTGEKGYPLEIARNQEKRVREDLRLPAKRRPHGHTRAVPLLPDNREDEMEEHERKEYAVAALKRAFQRETQEIEEFHPFRIRVAHRIVREILRVTGACDPDQRLIEAMVPDRERLNPWTHPLDRATSYDPYSVGVTAVLERAHEMGFSLSVTPPPAPEGGSLGPMGDRRLLLFVALVEATQRSLNIEAGVVGDPQRGILGLKGLVDPLLVRRCWPLTTELLAWEECLIQDTLEFMIQHGQNQAARWLRDEHGFFPFERAGWLRIAKNQAREITEGDIEDDRAFMVMRLEDYMHRCREAFDRVGELRGLKILSLILGLSKVEPEDAATEFSKIVNKLDAVRPARPQEPPQITTTAVPQPPKE